MIFKAIWHVIQSDRWGFPRVLRFPPTESTQTQTSVPINKVKIQLCLMFILFILPCFLVYRIHNGLSEMLEMTMFSLEEFHWIWQILNNYSPNSCNETLWPVHIYHETNICTYIQVQRTEYSLQKATTQCCGKNSGKKKVQVIPVHLRLHW